jgi:hypothetical protein
MSTAIARVGQTLTDISIQHLGSEEAVGELARLNSLDLTAVLIPGQVLYLPDVVGKRVVRVYTERNYVPAANVSSLLEGIDYWAIGIDFMIS